ncbi:hypothetical protein T484DRAFT_1937646, partial [Baffinella frigidus]
GDGSRIISWTKHQNDSRIDWTETLPLGTPFEPDLHYWWGDDEPDIAAYDLLNLQGGVPAAGEGSLWPTRGRPVQSIMAEALRREAVELKSRHTSPGLRGGRRAAAVGGAQVKPAVVYVTFLTQGDEEQRVAAFAQEALGDVFSRIVRQSPAVADFKVTLTDGRVLGLPTTLGGVPLETRLAELGLGDGGEMNVRGVAPGEAAWPAFHALRSALDAFLSGRPWPPCDNFLRRYEYVGSTSPSGGKEGGGDAEDNRPRNLLVAVLPDGKRVCYNKQALLDHLQVDPTLPGSKVGVDARFVTHVRAARLLDTAFVRVFVDQDACHGDTSAKEGAEGAGKLPMYSS